MADAGVDNGRGSGQGRLAAQMSWKVSYKGCLITLLILKVLWVLSAMAMGLGYRVWSVFAWWIIIPSVLLYWIIMVFCSVKSVVGFWQRTPIVLFTVLWIVLVTVALPQMFDLSRTGAVWNARSIGFEVIVRQGRELIEKAQGGVSYDEPWHMYSGDPNMPPGICRLYPHYTSVVPDSVYMEIYTYGRSLRGGFTVMAEGHECEYLKLADGLYWEDHSLMMEREKR